MKNKLLKYIERFRKLAEDLAIGTTKDELPFIRLRANDALDNKQSMP